MTPQELDGLFAEARTRPAGASPEFLARVLDGAYASQPARAMPVAPPRPAPARGMGARVRNWVLGFGGPAAGLACATMAGLWIGFAQPASLQTVTTAFQTGAGVEETVELIPSPDGWLGEG